MKKNRIIFAFTIFTLISALYISCYTPSPLYGKWADNLGNQIVFEEDGNFKATIFDGSETKFEFEGTWNILDNTILFKYKQNSTSEAADSTDSPEINRIAEWDILGSRLTIKWTINEQITKNLVLWHIER